DASRLMAVLVGKLRSDGHAIQVLDMGGGLGIDYSRGRDQIPSPDELTAAVLPVLRELGLRLLLEPGRSLVARAGALVGRVLGVKDNGRKHFLVTDASMAQLIRPCLYGAYHHIELLDESPAGPEQAFDVVGPICESGDFLGQGRQLPTPRSGDGILIYDAGAYGFSMASRYNLHLGCAEYLIDGNQVRRVRTAETFDDLARHFSDEAIALPR
ncbi:MAG TPA: diaminopimelate decarboxylase, partial [Pseudomonadota bacterium]|nr:diaminopimelate decarboxylase [Pseudomonadota bacterium]